MRALLCAALFAAAPMAMAQNWIGLLKNTPAERFDEEDLRLFMDNWNKVLAEGKENEASSWQNPKTRARGDATLLRSFEHKGMPCKEVRIYNEAQGRKNTSNLSMCQLDGKWRLLGASQLKK